MDLTENSGYSEKGKKRSGKIVVMEYFRKFC